MTPLLACGYSLILASRNLLVLPRGTYTLLLSASDCNSRNSRSQAQMRDVSRPSLHLKQYIMIMLVYRSSLISIKVIQDYVTPPNNTLSRHLVTHLSPQITHLVSARPMSVTMGNAIRQLKLDISGSDIDLPEQDVGLNSFLTFTHVLIDSTGEKYSLSEDR